MHHARRTRGRGLHSDAARRRWNIAARSRLAQAAGSVWCCSSVVVQRCCNLRMDNACRSSRHRRIRSQFLAHGSRKWMLHSNDASRRCGSRRGHTSICNRNDRHRWTSARRSLAVNDLFQAAMFKQNMLSGVEIVGGLAELVGDTQRRSVAPAIFNAGIAASCHSKPQIERA